MVSPSPSVRVLTGGAERLLSVRQVAEHLGVCTAVVYRLVERGDLPHVRVSNAVRVAPADLAAFLARRASNRGRVSPQGGSRSPDCEVAKEAK